MGDPHAYYCSIFHSQKIQLGEILFSGYSNSCPYIGHWISLVATKNELRRLTYIGNHYFPGVLFISNSEICRKACYSGVSPWCMKRAEMDCPSCCCTGLWKTAGYGMPF